jgi:hypothetical protein
MQDERPNLPLSASRWVQRQSKEEQQHQPDHEFAHQLGAPMQLTG